MTTLFGGWIVQDFMAVQTHVLCPTKGWTKRHVGMYRNALGFWWLVHLNSGHGIVRLGIEDPDGLAHETREQILPWADAVVDAADWDFSDLGGWRNRTPDLPEKLQKIANVAPPGMICTPEKANVNMNATLGRRLAFSRMSEE